MRHLLNNSEEWDTEAWGIPISGAHLGYAVSAFSARLLKHMKTLGAAYSDEEYASFMAVWRYTGHLMGIPETILFHNADEALRLYDVGLMCEPNSPIESIAMAHSLVNSAPLIAGRTDPEGRRHLARYVYSISRKLIGTEAAQSLMYPRLSSFGVVWWFRTQQRYGRFLDKLLPSRRQNSKLQQIHVLAQHLVVRRGRNPLHITRPRIRRRVHQVVNPAGSIMETANAVTRHATWNQCPFH